MMREVSHVSYPCKPQFYYIKVGFEGVYSTRTCFRDVEVYGVFQI